MPIKINLLAEQQSIEEMRRKDPVKRGIYIGIMLAVLMGVWALMLQADVISSRSHLSDYESKLSRVEESSKQSRSDWLKANEIEKKLGALEHYSTNRLYWGTILNALQQTVVEGVRVVDFVGDLRYVTNAEVKFKTNIVMAREITPGWKFWASAPPTPDISSHMNSQLALVLAKPMYATNRVEPIKKIEISTNVTDVTAKIEITYPSIAAEFTLLTIRARDYSNPPGKQVDAFMKAVGNNPYFKKRLHEVQGISKKDQSLQPETDLSDPGSASFISFVVECRFDERIFTNE